MGVGVMKLSLAICAMACAAVATVAAAEPMVASGIQMADMDSKVRPQDDFFAYANGTWLRKVDIPPDRARYGVDILMTDQALAQMRALVDESQRAQDAETRKVGDLYASFMDEVRLEKLALEPLQPEFSAVSAIKDAADLGPFMGEFNRLGELSPVGLFVAQDAKKSTEYALWLSQSGLGLPDRDYYLSNEAKLVGFRTAYQKHIARMLTLAGDANAAAKAKRIVALETAIARVQWTREANRDPQKTYNPRTVAQLAALAPAIDWQRLLSSAGLTAPYPTLVVAQPSYLRGLSLLIKATPVSVWQEYFRFHVLSGAAAFLSKAFVDEDFAFNEGVLRGTPKNEERWKRGCELVDGALGEALGKLYAAKYFPPSSKARADELVANLLKAYSASVEQLSWMSAATKVEAQAKLRKVNVKIGYPKHWRDYSSLAISPTDLIGNLRRAHKFEYERKLKQLGGPIDRDEWGMSAPTVNAYYNPGLNEVVFPAGILQLPVFNPNSDDAYNYGATGATIGHELSHGFDDEGSQFDSDGNLRDWWTPDDHAKFKAKTDKLVLEYGAFEPVPGFKVNGAVTLGENIADIAGIEIAYKAYIASLGGKPAPVIDGLTGDQRFLIGYAQSWMDKTREAALIAQIKADPHAPEKYRTNGVVVHLPAFYSAFAVKPGDKMYVPPQDRVTLW
jgi:putative endopeptidase